jgi:predicted MFS family arabinose efflux permease
MACGISLALTAIYLNARGFRQDIGTLSIFFASGLVLAAIPTGALIRRFSGKRVLTASMFGYAASVALFPLAPTYAAIAAVRFIDGICSMGIWVSSESIVLSRVDKEHKAYLTTLYAICLGSGYVAGSGFAWAVTHYISDRTAFFCAAAIALASTAYILLRVPLDTLDRGASSVDEPSAEAPSPPLSILWRIKNSCFAMFAYGYFQASVVLYLPLFMTNSKGIPEQATKIFVGLFCFGMLTWSNFAGRIADRMGHLRIMRILAFTGLLCVLGFVFIDAFWLMCVGVFVAGGAFGSMSGVSLALTGIVTKERDYSRGNSIYNVFYASGILIGPLVSGVIFERFGGEKMLYHHAALWTAFVLFTVIFMLDDPAARRKRAAEKQAPSAASVGG